MGVRAYLDRRHVFQHGTSVAVAPFANTANRKEFFNHVQDITHFRFGIRARFGWLRCPGTAPQDMSAAQHEAMAKQEDSAAAGHEAQHDPNASEKTQHCPRGQSNPCWTSIANPTQKHESDAEAHKEMAAKHRAAAGALARAEAEALRLGAVRAGSRSEIGAARARARAAPIPAQ